jgi:hypothetical protein
MRPHTEKENTSHMRTKTLLLTAALSAAGLATSMAQVYSVNAVGYVNQTVPAGGYAILAIPLNGTNNDINTTIPLPNDGSFDGASIYRFNPATQAYRDTMQWVSGIGWLASDPADLVINPGEGFFMQNVTGSPMPLTFVGEVPQGTLNNPIRGNNAYQIRSSIVPKGGPLGWVGNATTLEFPADSGDSVFIFDSAVQQYKETHQYVEGLGWLHSTDPLEGPTIAPGTGFFVQKVAPDRTWTQTFSVN